MSHKRKYKKDSFTGEKEKAWNRGKRTKMPATVIEGLAATDKGSFYNQQAWLEEYTYGEGLYYKSEHSNSSDFFFLMLKAVTASLIAIVIILKNL